MKEEYFDIRWTCPICGKVTYSNRGHGFMQCNCDNRSPYMNKEYTEKGSKFLKPINKK